MTLAVSQHLTKANEIQPYCISGPRPCVRLMRDTPISLTRRCSSSLAFCTLHIPCSLALFTRPVHSSCSLVLFTRPVNSPCSRVLFTRPPDSPCPLRSPSSLVPCLPPHWRSHAGTIARPAYDARRVIMCSLCFSQSQQTLASRRVPFARIAGTQMRYTVQFIHATY